MNSEYAVGVVGLGPTGLIAAIKLAQKYPHLNFVAFEKRSTPIRQQAVYLKETANFVRSLITNDPEDLNVLPRTSTSNRADDETNLKDLEAFLRRKIPSNVNVVYLDKDELLDIVPDGDQHFISIQNTSTGKKNDYYCRHILGTDGGQQYSKTCIEKNFNKKINYIQDDEIGYHASIQLKVDLKQTQPQVTRTTHNWNSFRTFILNRASVTSKKEKFSVTCEIAKDLFEMTDHQKREAILLDIARNAVINKYPHIRKHQLVLHQSKKHTPEINKKKDELRINCFKTQLNYCADPVVALHAEHSTSSGVYALLGDLRKPARYQKGEGVSAGAADVDAWLESFDGNTLSFNTQHYINKLTELDKKAYYLTTDMQQKMIALKNSQIGQSPKENLDHWIKNGIFFIENNKLTINYDHFVEALFNDEHLKELNKLLDKSTIHEVSFNCSSYSKVIPKIMAMTAQRQEIKTCSLFLGNEIYSNDSFIGALKNKGTFFERIEVTCPRLKAAEDWLHFIKKTSDKNDNLLQEFEIKTSDGSLKNDFVEQINLKLRLFLDQIAKNPEALEQLQDWSSRTSLQNHADLLQVKTALLEGIRTNPSKFYEQLKIMDNSLIEQSPLKSSIGSIITLMEKRNAIVENTIQTYEKGNLPKFVEWNDAHKRLTLHLSKDFLAEDEQQLQSILTFAKKQGCSTLVLTLPERASNEIGYMEAPSLIIKQLDTEWGKNIINFAIAPKNSQAANKNDIYYLASYAKEAKTALLKHGNYLKNIQIACKPAGSKEALFKDLSQEFKAQGQEKVVLIHHPERPINWNFSLSYEQQQLQQQQLKQAKLEQQRREQERLEQERLERERLEREKLEQQQKYQLHQQELEKIRLERERQRQEMKKQDIEPCQTFISSLNNIKNHPEIKHRHRREISHFINDFNQYCISYTENRISKKEFIQKCQHSLKQAETQFKNEGTLWDWIRPVLNACINAYNVMEKLVTQRQDNRFGLFRSKAKELIDDSNELKQFKNSLGPSS